jgi:predicted amino acid dehydrogenase
LHSNHIKRNCVILDDTQPRNTSKDLLTQRPDVTIIDGGLVSVPHLKFSTSIGLPQGISFACLAETMLLAKAGYKKDFSIGNPSLDQAHIINQIADNNKHLGFDVAPDHSFGKPIPKVIPMSFSNPVQLAKCI